VFLSGVSQVRAVMRAGGASTPVKLRYGISQQTVNIV